MPRQTRPKLPQLLERKIYKTGQTRGADDDVIYQNRVSRSSTVLIPYEFFKNCNNHQYENDFIVLIPPSLYFQDVKNFTLKLQKDNLSIGENALIFYEKRTDWNKYNPEKLNWKPATSRKAPLEGQYVARIAATTADNNGERINRGFTSTSLKGAGIRVYEYCSNDELGKARQQLEAIFWHCVDAKEVLIECGMNENDINTLKNICISTCKSNNLLDYQSLIAQRILSRKMTAICPLCLEELTARGFINRLAQAEGREVHDLTVTEINLFHINELRLGALNHRTYNLGWGHHHCNVVVKDSGIAKTLEWMESVLERNKKHNQP